MPDDENSPEPQYPLSPGEQKQYDLIKDQIATDAALYQTDADGNPILDGTGSPSPVDYVVLRTRRFLVDAAGLLWRFLPEGTKKNPDAPDGGGAPWRNNRVEMWTGKWRKVIGPDGEVTYAKVLTARPIDKRINGHPGMPQITWYRNMKGYKHPFDPPHAPTTHEIKALEGQRVSTAVAVYARMDAELAKAGLDVKDAQGPEALGPSGASVDSLKPKRRTNKRAAG